MGLWSDPGARLRGISVSSHPEALKVSFLVLACAGQTPGKSAGMDKSPNGAPSIAKAVKADVSARNTLTNLGRFFGAGLLLRARIRRCLGISKVNPED